MTLSGYLFARLLDGKNVLYGRFLWNRMLRLTPLLVVIIVAAGILEVIDGNSLDDYALLVAKGPIFPTLPNGGWSVTVEFHYYLVLPAILWLFRRTKLAPLLLVVGAIVLRSYLYQRDGEVQSFAYLTIVGRIDQFILGMFFYQFRSAVAGKHLLAIATIMLFSLFYWYFDHRGGFFELPAYPSPSRLWIVLPTLEGAAYGLCIAWYDSSFKHSNSGLSRFIGRIGEYSYSLYLLHPFVVFAAASLIHRHVMDIANFYQACLWSVVFFVLMLVPSYLSFRYIEAPFLRLRKPYLADPAPPQANMQGMQSLNS